MAGLNWLALLYKNKINGILADEMVIQILIFEIIAESLFYFSAGLRKNSANNCIFRVSSGNRCEKAPCNRSSKFNNW